MLLRDSDKGKPGAIRGRKATDPVEAQVYTGWLGYQVLADLLQIGSDSEKGKPGVIRGRPVKLLAQLEGLRHPFGDDRSKATDPVKTQVYAGWLGYQIRQNLAESEPQSC